MALTQPQLAELKSYTFFVSRRLEDGRERFRLHMGYFDSQLQAEDMLPVVRDLYPGAWAGEAPGKRLRARTAAVKAAPAAATAPVAPVVRPVVASVVAPVAAPVAAPVVAPTLAPSAAVLVNMPTLSAAPELTVVAPALKLELVAEPPRVAAAQPAAAPEPPPAVAPAVVAAPVPVPGPVAVMAPRPVPPATPVSPPVKAGTRAAAPKRDAALPFDKRSNVREVLKSLDESGRRPAVLPESQVLHLLEEKRGDPLNTCSTPAAFAVQLQWSVQAIDLARVPSLAIFGAYTLYTVEGSREGRRWFGLRLGFFSDANSAKQVAQYVRSEFSSVAVVPVSLKERDGASGATGGAGGATAGAGGGTPAPSRPIERLPDQSAEFKLLDDTAETPKLTVAAAAAAAARTAGSASVTKPKPAMGRAATGRPGAAGRAPGKTAKSRGNRVHAQAKRGPQTLEETLEILGADQLQMEGDTKPLVSDGTVRHLDVKVQKNSPFSRLLDRLAERGR